MTTKNLERMQCMEVWGGNQPANREFKTTGLDVWVYSQPHATAERGGDVYYISSCASGRITRLLLADVSGHGDSVAGVANVLRQLMRRNINYIDQSALVEGINREFTAEQTMGAFATALVGTYFSPTRTFTLSNAGHPDAFIYRAETGTWQELTNAESGEEDERHLPLGITSDQTYSRVRTKLKSGDLVLWFTDGLAEIEQEDGKLLGTDGLLKTVSQLDPGEPGRLIGRLLEQVAPGNSAVNMGDDVSVVLFQQNDERVSLRDNVMAPFRVVADLIKPPRDDDDD